MYKKETKENTISWNIITSGDGFLEIESKGALRSVKCYPSIFDLIIISTLVEWHSRFKTESFIFQSTFGTLSQNLIFKIKFVFVFPKFASISQVSERLQEHALLSFQS